MPSRRVPEATVARLPVYLRALVTAQEHRQRTISSDGLARAAGVNSANVRKDLSYLGSYGIRGVGYHVAELIDEISRVLGLTQDRRVVIVGVGNLGRALARYDGFSQRGFTVAALVDADPNKVGTVVGSLVVQPFSSLARVVAREGISFAILATPASAAQEVADRLVEAGVTAILNFAPAHFDVAEGVHVRKVDLSTELQILSFYEAMGASPTQEAAGG